MTTPAFAADDEQDADADNTVAVKQMSGDVKPSACPADTILPDSFGSIAHDRKPAQTIPLGVSHHTAGHHILRACPGPERLPVEPGE